MAVHVEPLSDAFPCHALGLGPVTLVVHEVGLGHGLAWTKG